MQIKEIEDKLKNKFEKSDELDEMISDLNGNFNAVTYLACEISQDDSELAKDIFEIAMFKAKSCNDYKNLAECIYENINDLNFTNQTLEMAKLNAKNFEDFLGLGESICRTVKNKEFAKEMFLKAKSLANNEELSELNESSFEFLGENL